MSPEKKPSKKPPAFIVEYGSSIELTSRTGRQSIERVDPALRPNVGEHMVEGERAQPSHPQTKKPHIDEHGMLHES